MTPMHSANPSKELVASHSLSQTFLPQLNAKQLIRMELNVVLYLLCAFWHSHSRGSGEGSEELSRLSAFGSVLLVEPG